MTVVREAQVDAEPRAAMRWWRKWGPAVAGPALIVAAVVVVMHGFLSGDRLSDQHPDILAYWLPTYCFLGESLAGGHIPAWNPFVMGGAPFAADPQSGWMYLPPMILFTALPCGLAMRLMIVIQPVLGGLGLYWFLRSEGLSRPAATVGGLALAVPLASSRLGLFLPFPASLAWTALTLAACSRYVRAESWPSRWWWCGLTAIAWGQLAAAHAGHGLVVGTAALAVFLATTSWSNVRDGRWTGRDAVAMVALLLPALLVVNLALLLPRLAYFPRSSYSLGYARLRQTAGRMPTWPLDLATTPGMYLGAITLGLSFAGVWCRRLRPLVVAFAVMGLAGYVLALDGVTSRLASLLEPVPVFNFYQHYPARLILATLLALPILAAAGVQAWQESRSARERALMVGPALVVWFALPPILGTSVGHLVYLLGGALVAAGILLLAAGRPALVALIPAALAVELAANGVTGQWVRSPEQASAGDPGAVASWFQPLVRPRVDVRAYLEPGPIANHLQRADGGRYMSLAPELIDSRGYLTRQDPTDWGLLANQRSVLFGLEDSQGYNPFQVGRYWSFVRAMQPERRHLFYNTAVFVDPPPIALDLLQVEWFVIPAGGPAPSADMEVTREGDWALDRRLAPPRVSLVDAWTVVPGPEEAAPSQALEAVTAAGFDPESEVVLERDPGLATPGGASPGPGTARVWYRSMGTQAAEVFVDSPAPAIVVVRNVHDPSWHASVDGRPVPLLVADYLVQGIAVSPGRHTVNLTYDDPTIGYGLAGSAVGVAIILGLAPLLSRTDRRYRRRGVPASPDDLHPLGPRD